MVAKVNEQHAAVVAAVVNPAREPDNLADVRRPQIVARVGAVLVHESESNRCLWLYLLYDNVEKYIRGTVDNIKLTGRFHFGCFIRAHWLRCQLSGQF
jgi:hypothetical protein